MAVLNGVKEKVHLPLYDSLFVRPRRQLREVESSSVLKFFANVHGKTKLETNMQSASLLPHWNTFEARALRVVISDLPTKLPEEVEKCLTGSNGAADGSVLPALTGCLDLLSQIITAEREDRDEHRLATTRECVTDWKDVVAKAGEIRQDMDECFNLFAALSDQQTIGRILQLQSEIRSLRSDLVEVISRTRIPVTRIEDLRQFAYKIEALGDGGEEKVLLRHLKGAPGCLQAFRLLVELVTQIKTTSPEEVMACVQTIEQLLQTETTRLARLDQVKTCLLDVQSQLNQLGAEVRQSRAGAIRRCLQERLSNRLLIPLDEQLFGNGTEILAKLIYNSVTTLFVGEKVMIQMPTWFFPAGAGPYSEDGRVVTHGFPAPEATFRFAEPVFIDAQQNFRVELEIPEASVLGELQRIYGPFFIWVALDGYMRRDVQ